MTNAKTFGDLYAAIVALPLGDLQAELFALWSSLEESESAVAALRKFDANVGDLSVEANAFYLAWVRA